MINVLRRGLTVLKSDSRLWMIFVLVVIFPVLFVYFYTTQTTAAQRNLTTILLSKISTIQDSIAISLATDTIDTTFPLLLKEQKELTKLQLVKEDGGRLVVTKDAFGNKIGKEVDTPGPFKSALIDQGTTMNFQYYEGSTYKVQAFRAVITADSDLVYIFTEHDFSKIQALFTSRANQPLYILVLIFLFIILLAYWLAKQINYQKLHQDLSETLKERDLFMNSLVHELRAPLTAMQGYASMIEESKTVPTEEREFSRRIKESTARLINLINDFLEAARIKSGRLPLTLSNTNISAVISRVLVASELAAKEKGLMIEKNIKDLNVSLVTDEKRIEQVITNMLSNSIKYTPSGKITVSLEKGFKDVVITIADTGHGISAGDQRKVFTPFVRVGEETVTGTGLGMWITRQLVEQLKGTIELESIKGVGTHVIITLPLKG